MSIHDIVDYWSKQYRGASGEWLHPDDESEFESTDHTFNLDFPVSPYVGDLVNAPIIILGANAGYDPVTTPAEFAVEGTADRWMARVRKPEEADWSFVSSYYQGVNYGRLLASGEAALINACPYRSARISQEPGNRRLLKRLPSTRFTRRWFLRSVLPLATSGRRLVV